MFARLDTISNELLYIYALRSVSTDLTAAPEVKVATDYFTLYFLQITDISYSLVIALINSLSG